jgi:hypothetical protein
MRIPQVMKKQRTHMKKTLAAAVGVAIAIGSLVGAGTANATTGDATFLQALANGGINNVNGPDYMLIQTGHLVCIDLQNGIPFSSEVWALQQASQMRGGVLSPDAAGFFISTAQSAYCPWTWSYTPAPVPPPPQLNRAV